MKKFLSICVLIFIVISIVATFTLMANAEEVTEDVAEEVIQPTVSEIVVTWVKTNADKLFTGATFVASLIVAYMYKKGLLPALSIFFSKLSGTLGDGVSSIQTVTEALAASTDERLKGFADTIAPAMVKASQAAEIAVKVSETVSNLQIQLEESQTDREVLKTVLEMQSKMFYEFFMAVNLPQYQKDKLGQTYAEMQKAAEAIKPKEVE